MNIWWTFIFAQLNTDGSVNFSETIAKGSIMDVRVVDFQDDIVIIFALNIGRREMVFSP